MLAAVSSLALLGAALGLLLGAASRWLRVEGNPIVDELTDMMPGSNCGQCGFPGCGKAAEAIIDGTAPPTCCPPGGKPLAAAIAAKLGLTLDLTTVADEGPKVAVVAEELCIGCCRCSKVCPTDAIIGAAKQIHNVMRDACTGCSNCIEKCPTDALAMRPTPITLQHWVMPKPALHYRGMPCA
ncbi:RnfABCDGE type electron transport complex subunit B [Denitromonas iodatirespirans]|uniref:Ion-translocating oxidoreductase complex subunit B n=1 Tax=Denitromonas iodatirespirans TaxID=2795389 RepID=A0A944H6V3_DENI1|nr:RnfABCDGE type electron transport complex subunit B [Denitromonas iodatirespirans]MBT0960533.1 RnfABCDGE type electron transport complex subunit B [Denitromonas iodatirespirans]